MGSSCSRRYNWRCFLGLFATTAVNAGGSNGLVYGNPGFFAIEVVAVILASVYAFIFTYIMLLIIDRFTPIRLTEKEEESVDESILGESAHI